MLNCILQLPHISGPVIEHELLHSHGRNAFYIFFHPLTDFLKEMLCQKGYILFPFP